MFTHATHGSGLPSARKEKQSACLWRWLLFAALALGAGGCTVPYGEQSEKTDSGIAPAFCSEVKAEPYTGLFKDPEQCAAAVSAYHEFLTTWIGTRYAAQYLDTLDSAAEFCGPQREGKAEDGYRATFLCAQACAHLQREDTHQAHQYILRALKLCPGFLPAQLIRAGVAAAQGNTSGALAQIEQVHAAYPYLDRLYLRMSILHVEQQDYARAGEDLQRYLYMHPDAQPVLLRLGQIQMRQEDFTNAVKTFQTLIDLAPDAPVAYFELGNALEEQQQFKHALNLYRTAAQTLEQSTQEFEYLQARLLLEQQEYTAAAEVLHSSLQREESAPLRLLYGFALMNLDRYAAAATELRQAAEALEFNSVAWLWLGKAHALQQQWYAAIAAFQQVSSGDARTEALLHLTGLYHAVGYTRDAIAALEELLALGLSDPIMYQHLGYLHIMHQDNAAAVKAFERGIEEYPDNVELKSRLGLLYSMLGEYAAALEYMEQVSIQRPDDVEVMNNLAYLYAEMEENLERAATLAQAALALEPRAEFYDTLGWVYVKQGRYDAALEYLRKALEMRPHDAQILRHLGVLYTAMGQEKQAEKMYLKAREFKCDNRALGSKVNPDCTERQAE